MVMIMKKTVFKMILILSLGLMSANILAADLMEVYQHALDNDPTFKKNILLLGAFFWPDTDNAVLMEMKTEKLTELMSKQSRINQMVLLYDLLIATSSTMGNLKPSQHVQRSRMADKVMAILVDTAIPADMAAGIWAAVGVHGSNIMKDISATMGEVFTQKIGV